MKSVGHASPLPNPNSVDAEKYDGWLIHSTDPSEKSKYYKLIGDFPSRAWVLQSSKIHSDTDPIIRDDGTVVRMGDVTKHLTTNYTAIFRDQL